MADKHPTEDPEICAAQVKAYRRTAPKDSPFAKAGVVPEVSMPARNFAVPEEPGDREKGILNVNVQVPLTGLVCTHGFPESQYKVSGCPEGCTVFDRMPGSRIDRANPRALIRFGLERAAYALALEDSDRTRNAMMEMSEAYLAYLESQSTVLGDSTPDPLEVQIKSALKQVARTLKRLR